MAANPNTISAGIQETWDKTYQVTHHKMPVYPAFTNFRLAAGLRKGDTIHRQYRNTLIARDMDGDGGYNRQAITDTDETLTIDNEKETSFYIKELDEIQNHLPTRREHAHDAAVAIFNQIDGDVLGTYDQFDENIDDGDLGGTAGNGITVTVSNVRKLFTNATKKLQRNNIMIQNTARFTGFRKRDFGSNRGVAILSPDVYQTLLESLEGKESALGDRVGINGHMGRYYGYDIFVSNAVGWSAVLSLATNPTDGDTITIGDATFRFKDSLAAKGDVHIGSTVDETRANLANAINAPTTDISEASATGFTSFDSDSDEEKQLINVTATNDNTADTLTLKAVGEGFIPVSETLTDGTDTWTAAKEVQHCLIGVAGAVDLVIQKTPSMKVKDRDGKVGVDVVTWAVYGFKVFNEGKPKMIDVQVRTDQY